jgi:hypothetical protein
MERRNNVRNARRKNAHKSHVPKASAPGNADHSMNSINEGALQ